MAQFLDVRERVAVEVAVENFIGVGAKELGKVKIWVATKLDQDLAALQAQKYVEDFCKSCPSAANDPDILQDAKAVHILHKVVRDASDPNSYPAFPTPRFMIEKLSRDEIASLLNHYNMVASQFSPLSSVLNDEQVESVVKLCKASKLAGVPSMHLSVLSRDALEDIIIRLSDRMEFDGRKD